MTQACPSTLFTAVGTLDGAVTGSRADKHRHSWWDSSARVDKEVPKDVAVHMVVENYITHQHPSKT